MVISLYSLIVDI